MPRYNGGPAFPNYKRVGEMEITEGGMSMRDYFATHAMQALITNPTIVRMYPHEEIKSAIAQLSYEVADVMMAERDK